MHCHLSGTADLYGSLDPFQRQPRSPKALALSSEVEIIKVDLSGYSQVNKNIPSPRRIINVRLRESVFRIRICEGFRERGSLWDRPQEAGSRNLGPAF